MIKLDENKPYSKTTESWKGAKDFGKIICVDFDGVICKFDGWQGPNVFGEVIPGARVVLDLLQHQGWYICLFTTRLVTIQLIEWLAKHEIVFDDINGLMTHETNIGGVLDVNNLQSYNKEPNYDTIHAPRTFYWRHNPEMASIKPIASVYLDDMSWENEGKNYTLETWIRVYESLTRRFPNK